MMAGDPPFSAPEGAPGAFDAESLQRIFACFTEFPHIGLAVSGGADSTALMMLVRRWLDLDSSPSPLITVLTVDHRLRTASAAEARLVREQAAAWGFPQHTLEWTAPKPGAGLQEAARHARYALLTGYCHRHAIPAIATAHTQDDQAETVLMRLARGSGVDGLSGMTPQATLDGIALLRPLLAASRGQLRHVLKTEGVAWAEDPTNEDPHYERVRIRRALSAQTAFGLSSDKLALTAKRLARARDTLDALAAATLQASLTLGEAGWATMPLEAFNTAADETAVRMLSRIVLAFGGGDMPVALAKVEAACEKLRRSPQPLTLGGCQIAVRAGQLRVTREYGRMPHGTCAYRPGMLWDRRFIIESPSAHASGLEVRPLGPDGIKAAKEAGGILGRMPRGAALALPSLWRDASLVFAPFMQFPQGLPPGWIHDVGARFANRGLLFDTRPEIRL